MSKIRLTKEFSFETAHALGEYDGLCRNIHGHSYRLFVTVAGTPSDRDDDPKKGMVMDFGDLKRIVRRLIVEPFDHALVTHRPLRRQADTDRLAAYLRKHDSAFRRVDSR